MYIVQEIYYITTGNYRHRKECYLVYSVQSGYSPVKKVLTREQVEKFNTEVNGAIARLPALKVTPTEFREFERQIKY